MNPLILHTDNQQESPPAWTQEAYRPPRGHSNFLLFRGGGPLTKKFFSSLNMYQAKSGVKKFSLYWGGGGEWGSLDKKIFFPVWTCIKPNLVSKIFPFTETGTPHPVQGWMSLPENLRPGIPPSNPRLDQPTRKSETWDPPPPPKVNRQTFPSINITFPRTTYAGGKNGKSLFDL